jgi:hypothetical protein
MTTRRKALISGFALGICACGSTFAKPYLHGCSIQDSELTERVGNRPKVLSFNIETDVIKNGSGNKPFDIALAHTLSKLSDIFGVLPGFAFFDDGNSFNAFASGSQRLGRGDGSVIFGMELFTFLMSQNEAPEAGIAAVCAHEFGHIVQYKRGVVPRLVQDNGRVKRLELHADYLAGYFSGLRKRERAEFPSAVFAATQYLFGDTNFGHAGHHGTKDERAQAVIEGFQAAYRDKKDFDTAVEHGIDYVLGIAM